MSLPLPSNFDPSHRLAALGLEEDIFRTALLKGKSERNELDDLHTDIGPGVAEWDWILHSLRAQLVKKGWTKSKWRNVERVVNPTGDFGIFVMRGSAGTGLLNGCPTSLRPKKSDYQCIVEHNGEWRPDAKQISLLGEFVELPISKHDPVVVDMVHWCLLFNSTDTEIRSELSFPISMDTKNFVRGWKERIPLNTIHLEVDIELQAADLTDEISFDVLKKEA